MTAAPATPAPATAPAPERPDGDRWVARLLTAGWVIVGLSFVVYAVRLIRMEWAPVIDNALIAALTVDTVSLDPPLVGMPTSLGLEGGAPLSHAGPLGFWLLAIPAKVLGEPGDGLIVGALALSLLSLAGIAVLVRRRGDAVLEALALVSTAAMAVAIGGEAFVSPFNPYLGILPLLLCLFAVWGVASGHPRQLWVVVLAGSLAAQTHLGYVPLVAALVALTAGSLAFDVARSSGASRRRLVRTVIPVGVLLGVLAWIGPILDQLFGTQNLTRLLGSQSGDRRVTGFRHGAKVALEMTSVPPRWLLGRAGDEDLSDPSVLRVVASLAAIAWVVGLFVWALRRRDRALASLTVVAGVSVAAAAITSARLVDPEVSPYFRPETAVLYRLFWWPVGVIFSLTVLWGAARVGSAVLGERTAPLRRARVPLAAGLVTGVLALVWLGSTSPDERLEPFLTHELANAEAIADLPGSPDTVVLRFEPEGAEPPATTTPGAVAGVWDLGPHQRYGYAVNLVAQLRLRGIEVRFAEDPDDGVTFMLGYRDEHRAQGDEPIDLLYLVGPDALAEAPAGYRRISGPEPGQPVDPLDMPTAVYLRTSGEP